MSGVLQRGIDRGCVFELSNEEMYLRLPEAGVRPRIARPQEIRRTLHLSNTAMNALPQFGFRYRSAVLFTHPPDRC